MVAADLNLGGFSGQWGEEQPNVQRKRKILSDEGVLFDANGKVSRASLYHFPRAAAVVDATTFQKKSVTKRRGRKAPNKKRILER